MSMTDNEFDIVAQLLGKAGMGERLRVAYLLAMADLKNAPGGHVKMQTEAADRTPTALLLATSSPDLIRRVNALLAEVDGDGDDALEAEADAAAEALGDD